MAQSALNIGNLLADSPKVIRISLHGAGSISAANIKLCFKASVNACTGVRKDQWKKWFSAGAVVPDLREKQESVMIDWDKAPIVKKTTSFSVEGEARAKQLPILTGGLLIGTNIAGSLYVMGPLPEFLAPNRQLEFINSHMHINHCCREAGLRHSPLEELEHHYDDGTLAVSQVIANYAFPRYW